MTYTGARTDVGQTRGVRTDVGQTRGVRTDTEVRTDVG